MKTLTNDKEALGSALQSLYQNKTVKTILYVGAAVVAVYALGKIFSVLAGTIRSYREFHSAAAGS